MNHIQKIARLEDEEQEFSLPQTYRYETMSSGSERIVIGLPRGDTQIFLSLAQIFEEPYYLLYILHTPRGEGKAGRYQSAALDKRELVTLIEKYSAYLSADGRFDLWVHSQASNSTLVWDRHNLIYAYGQLEKIECALRQQKFEVGKPQIDFEHVHYYRSEFDVEAKNMLKELDWKISELRPEDEQ